MLILVLIACKQDDAPHNPSPQDKGEQAPPEAQAVLHTHWYLLPEENLFFGYLWLAFADPAPEEPERIPIDTCLASDPASDAWHLEPALLDVGEIIVRIRERIVPEDWGEDVLFETEYPAGERVWFEVTGGPDLSGFVVPELVELPQPVGQPSVSFSPDGALVQWLPSAGADVEISLGNSRDVVYCRAQDDGEFVVPASELPEDPVSIAMTRAREGSSIEGDVFVRGIASHATGLPLGEP